MEAFKIIKYFNFDDLCKDFAKYRRVDAALDVLSNKCDARSALDHLRARVSYHSAMTVIINP